MKQEAHIKESSLRTEDVDIFFVQSLLETVSDPLVTLDLNGKITHINDATVRLTGVHRKKIIGADFATYFTNQKKAREGYEKAIENNILNDFPLTLLHVSGKTYDVLYNARTFKDDKGNVKGIIATARDISELEGMKKKAMVLEGAEELLVEWAFSLSDFAFASNNKYQFFREIERNAALHWFKRIFGTLPKANTPYEAAITFRDLADERNVILKENFELEEDGNGVIGTFKSHDCPYRECSALRLKENAPFVCFRATPFITAMQLMINQQFKSEVIIEKTIPGEVCNVRAMPVLTQLRVALSLRQGKGTVKINEIDRQTIGIDFVDNVVIKSIDGSNEEIALMSFVQSRTPSGHIFMNPIDAKSAGIKEDDLVYIITETEGKDVDLVGNLPDLNPWDLFEDETDYENVSKTSTKKIQKNVINSTPQERDELEKKIASLRKK